MPIKIIDVLANRRTLAVSLPGWGGDALGVTYLPNAITPERVLLSDRVMKLDDNEAKMAGILDLFCAVVSDWDLIGPYPADGSVVRDGEHVPVRADIARGFGMVTLNTILQACIDDVADPKSWTTSNHSSNGMPRLPS